MLTTILGLTMRTLEDFLFRSWNGKDMVYHRPGAFLPLPGEVLMQYTGLVDKNGNKIWEGDILNNPQDDYHTTIDWDFHILKSLACYHNEAKVLGNIHQNPELLNRRI